MPATHGSIESRPGASDLVEASNTRQPLSFWFIAATAVSFFLFWPLGLALLTWAFFRKEIEATSLWQKIAGTRLPSRPDLSGLMSRRPSNAALAEYLAREQERLRDEQKKLDELQRAFEAFKTAERQASDQRDFENFLRQREGAGREGASPGQAS